MSRPKEGGLNATHQRGTQARCPQRPGAPSLVQSSNRGAHSKWAGPSPPKHAQLLLVAVLQDPWGLAGLPFPHRLGRRRRQQPHRRPRRHRFRGRGAVHSHDAQGGVRSHLHAGHQQVCARRALLLPCAALRVLLTTSLHSACACLRPVSIAPHNCQRSTLHPPTHPISLPALTIGKRVSHRGGC